MQQAPDPMQILQHQRLVDAKLALQIGLVGGIDEAGGVEQDIDDIAGHDAEQEEDDDRNPDQGHEHQSKAPHDISKHLGYSCWLAGLPVIRGGADLLVQPHVLVTIAVIGAVHHDGHALDIGLPAGTRVGMEDDRAGDVFLKFLVDLPDQLLALVRSVSIDCSSNIFSMSLLQ